MNTGNTAWVLVSAALVLLMTPGLAFFYGGMVRAKSVLNMMMMSFLAMAIVPVLWILYGYSLAFGDDAAGGLVGRLDQFGLRGIGPGTLIGTPGEQIPSYAFVAFQLMFAIITIALISGAVADRVKFASWAVFVVLWASVVYFPVAHWVFAIGSDTSAGGWIANSLRAFDFAGGTAVHINAGAAGLALTLVLGKRIGWTRAPMRPHNLPFVLLGAGLLWFGWYGFNAGSALAANQVAALAFLNTTASTATAMLGWLAVETFRDGRATSLGAASGAVAGLVAITPACASITPAGSLLLGLVAGIACAYAVGLKYRCGFDDSLDVVGVHLVGGVVGTVLIGLLCTADQSGVAGLLYGGGFGQLGRQVVAAVAVLGYSFTLTFLIATLIDKVMGFRIAAEDEVTGIDQVEHLETAYEFATIGGTPRGHQLTQLSQKGYLR